MLLSRNELFRPIFGFSVVTLLIACSPKDPQPEPPISSGGSSMVPASGGASSGGFSSGTGGSTNSSGGVAPSLGGSMSTSGGATSGGSGGIANMSGASSGGASSGGKAGGGGGGALGGTSGSGGGSSGSAGGPTAGSSNGDGHSPLGSGSMMGSGKSSMRYETVSVKRDDVPYVLITNGWGPGFGSHTVSWSGTSFTIETMMGTAGPMYQPASYPSVFCGKYSVMQVPACGLPATLTSIKTLRTGWRWAANGNSGEYNAAYDIWLGDGNRLQAYLMVWLRDPPGQQPAGQPNMQFQNVTVANAPGVWNIWNGMVNGLPIVNYVRAEGMDSSEIEFDVMDFYRDVSTRGVNLPGNNINAVAVGFEIWEGPINNLQTLDFYVDVN